MSSSLICPACGGENAPDSRFCRHCGASLLAPPINPTESVAPTPTSTAPPETVAPVAEAPSAVATVAVAPPAVAAPVVVESPVAPAPTVAPVSAPAAPPASDEAALSSPAEIDARRARQLLERALFLSERGDAAGAILACRQSIALSPTVAGGYSMLGLLLERSGDLTHSVAAYEKALQLAPDSVPERETLNRLQEKLQGQQGASLFHFDDNELFSDARTTTTPERRVPAPVMAAPAAPVAPASVSPAPPAPTMATPSAAPAPAEPMPVLGISAAAPGLPAETLPVVVTPPHTAAPPAVVSPQPIAGESAVVTAPTATTIATAPVAAPPTAMPVEVPLAPPVAPAPVISERRREDRRQAAAPIAAERRVPKERRAPTPPAKPSIPISLPITQARPNTWSNLWKSPSFYGRSLPLMAATVLSLGFLSWARSLAIARDNSNIIALSPSTTTSVPETTTSTVPQQSVPPTTSAVPPPSPNGSGFQISNRPFVPAAPLVAAPPLNAAPGASAPTTPRGPVRPTSPRAASPRPAPRSSNSVPPAIVSPAAPTTAPASSSGGNITLPAPVIEAPAPAAPPVEVLPSNSNTPPLNPSGSSDRGYVRITQGRIGTVVPQRAQGNAAERSAASAAAAGQPDRAIDRLTTAINAGGNDAGFRFQQRATLFLNRGDYSRAAEDFQSAISAYNDQINRGDQVTSARAGLQAARSGLNVALAGGRR